MTRAITQFNDKQKMLMNVAVDAILIIFCCILGLALVYPICAFHLLRDAGCGWEDIERWLGIEVDEDYRAVLIAAWGSFKIMAFATTFAMIYGVPL